MSLRQALRSGVAAVCIASVVAPAGSPRQRSSAGRPSSKAAAA